VKGDLGGREETVQSNGFLSAFAKKNPLWTVASTHFLECPGDNAVHSEWPLWSQNPRTFELEVTLKLSSSRPLFYKWRNWDTDEQSDLRSVSSLCLSCRHAPGFSYSQPRVLVRDTHVHPLWEFVCIVNSAGNTCRPSSYVSFDNKSIVGIFAVVVMRLWFT
jgi:hypothetical protein